jgi:hypothetical protein
MQSFLASDRQIFLMLAGVPERGKKRYDVAGK